ncbi:hypothetical protein CWD94_25620 [Lysinibacillus xylanilyticus]|uniref:Uncharacterized protein n=1 Tax=Lysinibacillus xylanilyticus TaxID=582475 RepID=A0A2M9PYM3_9BACI|nr:hypothetical protein CWD94_25620 [Lysinibacillus xylanilyticus]
MLAPGSRANTMLVTKALSQDVMVLAFVPLFANPRGVAQSPLQSTNLHSMYSLTCRFNLSDKTQFSKRVLSVRKQQLQQMFSARKQSVSGNNVNYLSVINIFVQWFVVLASNFEMHKIYKNSTLLLIGVEGYSTPVGKRDSRDPGRSEAEEAARRSPTGKRVAWNGNRLYVMMMS